MSLSRKPLIQKSPLTGLNIKGRATPRTMPSNKPRLKARANERNMLHNIAQYCWAQYVAFVWTPCWTMLHDVGTCCVKFETSQTFCPTSANISFVFVIDEACHNMLGSFARFAQHCWARACALNASCDGFAKSFG